ncbi:MAG: DUF72 domain-containing protein [Candidatus Bathyarchaeia archaeon]
MIKVGCCGYPVSVGKYQEAFRLVELNSTFYKYPKLQTVKKWREKAPRDFEFTVKAHQDISHKYKLKLELAREPIERMKEICRTLNAEILLIQTAASFKPNSLGEATKFFEKIDRDNLTLVWETRGPLWEEDEFRDKLKEVLERVNVVHVTDPLRAMPVFTDQLAYFRLHGLGAQMYYYQYMNEELAKLYDLIKPFDTANKKVFVLFNNLSMFEDSKRFLYFLENGRFPPLTEVTGWESVKALIEKTKYPSTKGMLIKKLGWRLIELEDGKQIRLSELLKDLPSKNYKKKEEVLAELKPLNA